MPAIGSVWGSGTWGVDAWAENTWADAVEASESSPFVVCVTGADRLVVEVEGYTGGPGCTNRGRAGVIAIDEDAVITVGQDAVWKVELDAATTGTNWLLTVAENPDATGPGGDVALPDFLVESKEFDTSDWSAVFSSSATNATHHDPDGTGYVAIDITDAMTDLLVGSGPGRYVIDVFCTDDGSERPCYGPVWLQVLPPARRPA